MNVWHDNRSGYLGCAAGNLVLSEIAQEDNLRQDEIIHEAGTVFSTPDKVIVGRVCASDRYLQKDVAHFCNMSVSQAIAISHKEKQALFLFITISATVIHYWLVPSDIIQQALKTLKPKPSSPSCFVRIYNKSNRFFISDFDITNYHRTIRRPNLFVQAAETAVANSKNNNSDIPLSFRIDGVLYEAVSPQVEEEPVAV